MTASRARFIEKMTPNKRDVEIIKAIEGDSEGSSATAQPHAGAAPINNAWVQLSNVPGNSVVFENYSGKDLQVRRGPSATVYLPIPDGMGREVDLKVNANELYVRNSEDATMAEFIYTVIGEAS